jgi:GAF domain-containing protein
MCRVPTEGGTHPMTDHRPQTRPNPGDTADVHVEPAFAELARIVLGAQPLSAVLCRIAQLARETIPGADEVSTTLIERHRARTVGFAGTLAPVLDERQYASGRGPCMDAAVTGQTVEINDTATDLHYPEFSRQAHRHGIRHTLAIGMPVLQTTTGALNIYGRGDTGPFSDQAKDIAFSFAGYAAVAVVNAALYAGALQEVAQMKEAMTTRAVIEQAKGIIMRDQGCDADEAFDRLRNASMRANRKLRDVAQALASSTSEVRTP